jgi:hypothetical protein
MSRTRDLCAKVKELNRDLMHAFRQCLPSKQFQSELMLGQIGLNVLAKKLSQCRELSERRQLTDELSRGIQVMENGIQALREEAPKPAYEHHNQSAKPLQQPGWIEGVLPLNRTK